MRIFLSLLAAITVILVARPLWACDTTQDATPGSTCVVMPRGDAQGVWFDLPTVDQIKRDRQENPILRQQVEDLTSEAAARKAQAEAAQKANDERKEANARLDAALKASQSDVQKANQRVDAAEARANSLIRNPLLWAGIGLVVGGIVVYEVKH